MADRSDKEREKKKAIFDGMSPKRQQRILEKIGYDNWDPFQDPKYPIDLRERKAEQMAMALFRKFFSDSGSEKCSNEYMEAVKEISRGLMRGEERYEAMLDFCCWYQRTRENTPSV